MSNSIRGRILRPLHNYETVELFTSLSAPRFFVAKNDNKLAGGLGTHKWFLQLFFSPPHVDTLLSCHLGLIQSLQFVDFLGVLARLAVGV